MPTYTLSNTAADIDSAITRVASADTTPTDASQNMVTSGGVKGYIDNELGDFIGKTVTTSTDNFVDNDTSIPTCAAVKSYVDNAIDDVVSQRLKMTPFGDLGGQVLSGEPYRQTFQIPDGYKATSATIYAYGSDSDRLGLRVYECDITDNSETLIGSGTTQNSNPATFNLTDTAANATNYLAVETYEVRYSGAKFAGGYITLAPV